MSYDEYCKDMIKRKLFSNWDIVYIPLEDVLIQFGSWNVDSVVEELIDCEGLNEEMVSSLKNHFSDELEYFRRCACEGPDSDIWDTTCVWDSLWHFVRDVMNVFVAEYILHDEKPDFVPQTMYMLTIKKKALSLSDANDPDLDLRNYF